MSPAVSFSGTLRILSAGTSIDDSEIFRTGSSEDKSHGNRRGRRPRKAPARRDHTRIEVTSVTAERWGKGFSQGSGVSRSELGRLVLGPSLRFQLRVNGRKNNCYLYSEDELFVSICEDNDVSSFGRTPGDAQERLREALELFYEQ